MDNDDTVSELLKKMKSHKQGRLTFMPLNRLTRESFDYPESKEHVIPLISQLRYDPKYKDAVNQVIPSYCFVSYAGFWKNLSC